MVGKVHVPPSKKRYDQAHPVVSFRVSQEDYAALKKTLEASGKSIGQFFREALGTAQRDTRIAYKKGRRDGFKEGLSRGKKRYRVVVPCYRCAKWIPVVGKERRLKVTHALLMRKVWVHRECKPAEWSDECCELID
jgi:hypothetical protein